MTKIGLLTLLLRADTLNRLYVYRNAIYLRLIIALWRQVNYAMSLVVMLVTDKLRLFGASF